MILKIFTINKKVDSADFRPLARDTYWLSEIDCNYLINILNRCQDMNKNKKSILQTFVLMARGI